MRKGAVFARGGGCFVICIADYIIWNGSQKSNVPVYSLLPYLFIIPHSVGK